MPLGPRGEKLAAKLLRKAGMKVLGRNYRCPAGEIDLIVLDRSTAKTLGAETIVFVEVKSRSSADGTPPRAAVTVDKQARIRGAAAYYLAHYPAEGYRTRYDVVSVVVGDDPAPQVTHVPGAF